MPIPFELFLGGGRGGGGGGGGMGDLVSPRTFFPKPLVIQL